MAAKEGSDLFERFLKALHKVEDLLLAILLAAMILLACLQILLRNFMDAGIAWADPSLRILVLWLGLLGALAASRADEHISIDLLSRFLSPRATSWTRALTSLFTATVCGVVAYHSLRFVRLEFLDGMRTFGGLPNWSLEMVIPFVFAMIALRYGLQFVARMKGLMISSDLE
jgi:TRAP-type C4-dicarboxylate transport system permease small subunit